ncbi:hypothetical protein [Poseidonibacter sp.]|uniref:hypothetical protein n=1 Tax=Poseidonibacter sp. TaxID=2321188 RepID=UPI00359E9BAA
MLKKIMITLVILSCALFANEYKEEINACDAVYDECSLKCESNEATNNETCFAKCEMLYDKCQIDKELKEQEESNNQ